MSDSIPNAPIAMASSNPKDFSKKKRANRSAKLKQCKLDVRREQWLSQVKKNGAASKDPSVHLENGRGKPVENLEIKTRNEDEIIGDGSSMHHYSDSESLPSNSPSSHTSSALGSNDSVVNFTASSRTSSSSGRSSSGSSNDDDCFDDWEAVADALEAKDKKQQDCSPKTGYGKTGSPTPTKHENTTEINSNISNANSGSGEKETSVVNSCAWRPDDAYRPQNLPNLSKQYSFTNIGPIPTSCPICFEDFDCTDSSFLPCCCGFRLCLFCHKRILEEDGRCPGCRKKYECEPVVEGEAALDGGSLTFRLARSCSMIARF